jgi:hypothetical protein
MSPRHPNFEFRISNFEFAIAHRIGELEFRISDFSLTLPQNFRPAMALRVVNSPLTLESSTECAAE